MTSRVYGLITKAYRPTLWPGRWKVGQKALFLIFKPAKVQNTYLCRTNLAKLYAQPMLMALKYPLFSFEIQKSGKNPYSAYKQQSTTGF